MGYNKDMINDDTTRNIDFIPTDNRDEVRAEAAQWMLDNAFMALNEQALAELGRSNLSYISFELGGYVPGRDGREKYRESVTTRITLDDVSVGDGERYTDPEGSEWYKYVLAGQVSWPSYGSTPVWLARQRANLIDASVTLVERFNEAFAEKVMWKRSSTKAEREAQQQTHMRDMTNSAVFQQIQEAIHTTCRRMYVGNERTIPLTKMRSEIILAGSYTTVLENKEYASEVFQLKGEWRLSFRRTK